MTGSLRLLRAFITLLRLRGSVNRKQYWAAWVLLLLWYVLTPAVLSVIVKFDSNAAAATFLGTTPVFLWVCSGLMAARCRDAGKTRLWALTSLAMVLMIGTIIYFTAEYYLHFPAPIMYLPVAGAALVAIWLGFVKNADSRLTW